MGTIQKHLTTHADPNAVWDAIRDVGALHTRLVPGFVVDTQLIPGARVVTFQNGAVVTEPIVSVDEAQQRLVWTVRGGSLEHYNGAVQVLAEGRGCRVVWTADFLPDAASAYLESMISAGMAAMQTALDAL